jgi:hypothetical protein
MRVGLAYCDYDHFRPKASCYVICRLSELPVLVCTMPSALYLDLKARRMQAMFTSPFLPFLLIGLTALGTTRPEPGAAALSVMPSTRTVYDDDNGGTVTVHIGDRLLIKLASDWDWSLDPFDTAILSQVTESGALPRGAQAMLEAKKTGTTRLSLTGDPPCAKSRPPCNAPSRRFQVTVVVE